MADAHVAMLQRETRSSIEVTRNAKSEYQWSIKMYFEERGEDEALVRLGDIDAALREIFLPGSSGE